MHRELEKQGICDSVQSYMGVDSDGFMKLKSKSKKKAHKKIAARGHYKTRLRLGSANNSPRIVYFGMR